MNFKFNYNYPKSWLVTKIIASILLGLVIAIYIIEQQADFKNIISQKTKLLLEDNLACCATFTIDQINLFSGTIKLKNLHALPQDQHNQDWSWNCQKITIDFSWLNLLVKRKIAIKISIDQLILNSLYQNQKLAIADHLSQLLLAPGPLPIELAELSIQNGILNLNIPDLNLSSQIIWSSNSKTILNNLKSQIYLKSGYIYTPQYTHLDEINGSIQIALPFEQPSELVANCEINFKSPILDQNDRYFLHVNWKQHTGNYKLSSVQGKIDSFGCLDLPANNQANYNLAGSCLIKNLEIHDYLLLDQAQFTFNCHHNLWHGQLNLEKKSLLNIVSNWHWQDPRQLNLTGQLDCFLPNKSVLQNNYQAIFDPQDLQLTKLEISHTDQIKPYIYANSQKNGNVVAIFDLELMHSYLPIQIQELIYGSGKLELNTKLNQQIINCELKLLNGNLILPKIYNIIKDATGLINYDFNNQNLVLKDLNILLHQGNIKIHNAHLNNNYIYLPILFHNLALNFERNLITNCCGKISYQNHPNQKSLLKVFIVLEQTLCKYNPLSNDLVNIFGSNQSNFFKTIPSLGLDLNFLTLAPIKIKSEFLETNANANLQVTGQLINPKITGQVRICGGKINFPHKPLYITHGHINLTDIQSDQITIDLTAKNKIKNHNITMHLNGSISHPQINFDSSPSLTNEQIGALLLLGTDNTTLNMMMPAIIMQNLNHIVFGSIDDEKQTSQVIKKLFKPLDHVKFVPSFSDETGRGGLKGAVEINVNDRLHALIQKNFSLTEDVKLEIDYAISDDVSIRAISDERGDLGGELEIRFKI